MQGSIKISLFLLAFAFVSTAYADVDKDRDKDKKKAQQEGQDAAVSKTGQVGNCSIGSATAFLDVNNIDAQIFNTGSLFYKDDHYYVVPKGSNSQSIYASGIWIGGKVGGDLRVAGATYSDFEFWPGPLGDDGLPVNPSNCSAYDRIYKISRTDIEQYTLTGQATSDLASWPWQLGAPVIAAPNNGVDDDGDGLIDEGTDGIDNDEDGKIDEPDERENRTDGYDLAAGDRPELLGDQMLWWVMNDAGNSHKNTLEDPIHMEVHATAFAFNQAGALGNTTFYKYKLIYKGDQPLTDTWFGIFSDPDLGAASDDYVGSDPTLGLGYVYNGDEFDEGSTGYGERPPALGYDFFQGPLVDSTGAVWVDPDGTRFQNKTRLPLQRFMYFINGVAGLGDPGNGVEIYNVLQGLWADGQPLTFGGTGRGGTERAFFAFPDPPGTFWSEDFVTPTGARNAPDDRRFVLSTGPFTMQPGDVQEIVFGIVWSQGETRLSSVALLKRDDAAAQGAFNLNFDVPPPPDAPVVEVAELDEEVVLRWSNPVNSNNYLNKYDQPSAFIVDPNAADQTFTLEGYIIYQFDSESDTQGEIIEVIDRNNGIINIIDEVVDPLTGEVVTAVVVPGKDQGLRNYLRIEGLDNFRTYHFGVQAYAYNAASAPNVLPSPITRVTVTPSRVDYRAGGTQLNTESGAVPIVTARTSGTGGGAFTDPDGNQFIRVAVADPTQVTGDTYEARFYYTPFGVGDSVLTYNLVNVTDNVVLLNGAEHILQTGEPLPMGEDLFVFDGLSFTISGPAPGPLVIDGSEMFVEVVGPGGADPCGPDAVSTFGCDLVGGNFLYVSYNGTGEYLVYHTAPEGAETSIGAFAPHDFEIRFTEEGSYAYHGFTTGAAMWVPFEVWDIGIVGPFGENDPSDDVRMIPVMFSDAGDECTFNYGETTIIGFPATDRIYAYYPVDSYEAWEAAIEPVINADPNRCPVDPVTATAAEEIDFGRGRPIQRVVYMDAVAGGSVADLQGSVMRFYTTKPIAPGDVYAFDAVDLAPESQVAELSEDILDNIGIVPNPYRGASEYEITRVIDVVRFTNIPSNATIRVFTLSGMLIRTFEPATLDQSITDTNVIQWDLQTENGLPIASGMYLIHVDVPGVGERILKFGVVKKRVQLNEL